MVACQCMQLPLYFLLAYLFHDYAFHYPDETACWADKTNDFPTEFQTSEDQTNMAAVFATWFMIGFILSILGIFQVLCFLLYLKTKDCLFAATYTAVMFAQVIGNFAQIIMGTYDRFTHKGKVCAGVYTTNEYEEMYGPFLLKAGKFMKIYLVLMWIFLACSCSMLFACIRNFVK